MWNGSRIALTSINPDDAGYFGEFEKSWADMGDVFHVTPPRTEQQIRDWILGLQGDADADTFSLAIRPIGSDSMVGAISTYDCDRRSGCFRYGLALLPEARKRGYAAEAASIVFTYMFLERRFGRCTVTINAGNRDSIRLHERLGFVHEGTMRGHHLARGRRLDVHIYGLLMGEFNASRGVDPDLRAPGH